MALSQTGSNIDRALRLAALALQCLLQCPGLLEILGSIKGRAEKEKFLLTQSSDPYKLPPLRDSCHLFITH
jgi:hypothetical protein